MRTNATRKPRAANGPPSAPPDAAVDATTDDTPASLKILRRQRGVFTPEEKAAMEADRALRHQKIAEIDEALKAMGVAPPPEAKAPPEAPPACPVDVDPDDLPIGELCRQWDAAFTAVHSNQGVRERLARRIVAAMDNEPDGVIVVNRASHAIVLVRDDKADDGFWTTDVVPYTA